MKKLLGAMSVFTLVMTVPQIISIWASRQAAGVSLLSWGAYWIYLPCVGRLVLDGAVVVGAVIYG